MSAVPAPEMGPQPDTTGVSLWGRASRFERGIYVNIVRWARRRPDLGAPGSLPVPYVEIVRTTFWLWIGASALEMVAVHFIVPWPWVRWTLLVVSLWGLVWMIGFLAGLIVHPHLIEPDRVRVRNGHTIDAVIPINSIDLARTYVTSRPSSKTITIDDDDPTHLYIAVSGQVNIHLTLTHPIHVDLPRGRYTVFILSFWADTPAVAMTRLRELISAPDNAENFEPGPPSTT